MLYTIAILCTSITLGEDKNMDKETMQKLVGAVQEGSLKDHVAHLNIRDARAKLSMLVNDMENSQLTVTLGRRNSPTAVLTSYSRFEPFLSGDYKSRLAFMIVENLLSGAPRHIINPQIQELISSTKDDLLLLARIETLPLDQHTESEIRKSLTNDKILDRLLKRHHIASAIASAEKDGLYEASEDLTNRVNIETEDKNQAVG